MAPSPLASGDRAENKWPDYLTRLAMSFGGKGREARSSRVFKWRTPFWRSSEQPSDSDKQDVGSQDSALVPIRKLAHHN